MIPDVTKAQLENNKIVLTVQVDGFEPGDAVEISGQATQNNAAFATFDEIKDIPGTKAGAKAGPGSPAYPNGNSSLAVRPTPWSRRNSRRKKTSRSSFG